MRYPSPPPLPETQLPLLGTHPEGSEADFQHGITPVVVEVGQVATAGFSETIPQSLNRSPGAMTSARAARILAGLATERSGEEPPALAGDSSAAEPLEQLTNRYGNLPTTEGGLPKRSRHTHYSYHPHSAKSRPAPDESVPPEPISRQHAPDIRSHRRRLGTTVRQALASRKESIKALFARRPRYTPKHRSGYTPRHRRVN